MNDLQKQLFSMQDAKYRDFHRKLIPSVDPENIIGIRTPVLRKFSRSFAETPEALQFMRVLPHTYYEENNLHAFLIEGIKNFEICMDETERFLPYIDNWATCDSFMPKVFRKHPEEVLDKVRQWISDERTYVVRYGTGVLMKNYLDDLFQVGQMELVASIVSDEYYVNMMSAWYFATALAKQPEYAMDYIENRKLPVWVHNRAIQKAVESRRISDETKAYLKTLKIK